VTASSTLAAAGIPVGLVRPDELRATMRQHAAGVAVITTRQGGPVGFCATSLCTVSLEPPTVCFTVTVGSASGEAWRSAQHGIVHLLRSDQAAVASAFARPGPDKFADPAAWRWGPGGLPLLEHCQAWMLVSTRTRLVVGDHLLIIGDVRAAVVHPGPGPLVHHDGGFHALPVQDPASVPGRAQAG
jgi:flavin reductase (DIM6/NTAB) family NADH-FMN oxidoreductase RutF